MPLLKSIGNDIVRRKVAGMTLPESVRLMALTCFQTIKIKLQRLQPRSCTLQYVVSQIISFLLQKRTGAIKSVLWNKNTERKAMSLAIIKYSEGRHSYDWMGAEPMLDYDCCVAVEGLDAAVR